jgi:parvulin-like peptidyl-prolyl isomerase
MRTMTMRVVVFLLLVTGARWLAAQQVVDRIVARVENDIILMSEVRALGRYQQFLDGASETDSQILDRLIDQWIVRTEADVSRFPHPSSAEIDRGVARIRQSLGSAEEYESRKQQSGMSDQDIRAMVSAQLYLGNYLDSRFRSAVRIEPQAVEDFYRNAVVPRAKARGQEPPALDAARDSIEEALMQNGINAQADQWLKESRTRLHIEKLLGEDAK